jgi:hypothetical protein
MFSMKTFPHQNPSCMTAQLADAHAQVHRLVSVVTMATVLEEYPTEEQRSVVFFFFVSKMTQCKGYP